jgi:hypothetical protein
MVAGEALVDDHDACWYSWLVGCCQCLDGADCDGFVGGRLVGNWVRSLAFDLLLPVPGVVHEVKSAMGSECLKNPMERLVILSLCSCHFCGGESSSACQFLSNLDSARMLDRASISCPEKLDPFPGLSA